MDDLRLSILGSLLLKTTITLMSKQIFIITCYLLCCASCFGQSVQERYIEQYKGIAIREMERAGIPASIKLGQGILESNSGQSELARKAKNHFGMKCGSQWNGPTHYREDDDYNENGELIKSCFRVFRSHDASYVAHSEFLRDPRKDYRYGWLFDLNPRDYVAWAKGLKKSGYATSPTYAEKLIRIIETYDLHKYDFMAEEDLSAEVPDLEEEDERTSPSGNRIYSKRIFRNNDVRYVLAMANDTPHEIGLRYGIATRKLFRFNEQVKSPNQHLEEGERVYIQCKKNNYRGKRKYHYVKEGETMYGLSQKYGVKLKKLYRKNRMPKKSEPAPGTRLKIRGNRIKDYEKAPKRNDYRPSKPPPENKQTPAPDTRDEVEFDPDADPVRPEYEPVLTDRYQRKPPRKNEQPTRPTTTTRPSTEKTDRTSDTTVSDSNEPTWQDRKKKEEASNNSNSTSTTVSSFHTVAEGDTLYRISRLYDITVSELKKLNRLNSNIIHRGQQLRIK